MKLRIHRHPFLFTAVLALLALPSPQLALCVGDGGHRALEVLSASCCPTEIPAHTRDRVGTATHSCAPDCTDTPLRSPGALEVSSREMDTRADVQALGDLFVLISPSVPVALAPQVIRDRDGPVDVRPYTKRSTRNTVLRL